MNLKEIILLVDYKSRFGSKHNAKPYRSGMDKELLTKYFVELGYEAKFINFSEIDFRKMNLKGIPVLYTSQEDWGYHYKSYIEDIVLGLELQGATVIPPYKYLRANNNKVFMEILRDQIEDEGIKSIKSYHYGCLEELIRNIDFFEFPVVIKSAAGAMSTGVYLANDRKGLLKYAKKISRTQYNSQEIKDTGRTLKHQGYEKESNYREKFIVQNYIPDLVNDWKILIFGNRLYIFKRPNREKDFRASGSGFKKYLYGEEAEFPTGIFDFAKHVFEELKIPNLSLDIGFVNKQFHLIEFQVLYFGTVGHEKSNCFYEKIDNKWEKVENNIQIEKAYVDSVVGYLEGMNFDSERVRYFKRKHEGKKA